MLEVAAEMAGARVTCGSCKRLLLAPTPARLLPDTIHVAAERHAATLKTVANADFCRWRHWAAQVRDRSGPYCGIQAQDAELADALTKLMDSWEVLRKRSDRPDSATNLLTGLEANMTRMIGVLLKHGVAPPTSVSATFGGGPVPANAQPAS
jgi:hypothetical protein